MSSKGSGSKSPRKKSKKPISPNSSYRFSGSGMRPPRSSSITDVRNSASSYRKHSLSSSGTGFDEFARKRSSSKANPLTPPNQKQRNSAPHQSLRKSRTHTQERSANSQIQHSGSCEICSDAFDPTCEKQSGRMRKLPCGHRFHNGCIARWMFDHESMCPTCKKVVDMECDSDSERPVRLPTPSGLRKSIKDAQLAQMKYESSGMTKEEYIKYLQQAHGDASKDLIRQMEKEWKRQNKDGKHGDKEKCAIM